MQRERDWFLHFCVSVTSCFEVYLFFGICRAVINIHNTRIYDRICRHTLFGTEREKNERRRKREEEEEEEITCGCGCGVVTIPFAFLSASFLFQMSRHMKCWITSYGLQEKLEELNTQYTHMWQCMCVYCVVCRIGSVDIVLHQLDCSKNFPVFSSSFWFALCHPISYQIYEGNFLYDRNHSLSDSILYQGEYATRKNSNVEYRTLLDGDHVNRGITIFFMLEYLAPIACNSH